MAAVALAAAGCATLPTSGNVQQAQAGTGQVQQYPQLIAVGPQPTWQPVEIVSGFLHASASFADGHAVARQYLTPGLSKTWHPGWAVNVVATPQFALAPTRPNHIVGVVTPLRTVTLTGQGLATLTDSGQYRTSSGSTSYNFTLVKNDGVWRISQLPSDSSLLLTEPDFANVYTPHNLYFFAQAGRVLVPDPVFVPQPATDTDVAIGLIRGLLAGPQSWLSRAAGTDFPPRTKLLSVKINGSSVVVNLGGAAAKASRSARANMAAQLVWTFTSPSYSPSFVAQSVVLEINGAEQRLSGGELQLPQFYGDLVPAQRPAPLYFASRGAVSTLTGGGTRTLPGLGVHAFSAIAVSPDGQQFAGAVPSGARACTVYSGPLSGGSLRPLQLASGSACTSLSEDSLGEIWVAAGNLLDVLLAGKAASRLVGTRLPRSDSVTDVQVAPDNVRIAMIIKSPTRQDKWSEVVIGAIRRDDGMPSIGPTVAVGTGIQDPIRLTWYNADNILVLAGPPSRAGLYEVPVNGGESKQILAAPQMISITTDGTELAAGTARGAILWSAGLNAQWQNVGRGHAAAYPG